MVAKINMVSHANYCGVAGYLINYSHVLLNWNFNCFNLLIFVCLAIDSSSCNSV